VDWVIIGAGNFLGDILDAIDSNDDKVALLVLNTEITADTCGLKTISLDEYQVRDDANHIFGFLNPNKQKLVDYLEDNVARPFGSLIHKQAYIAKTACIGKGNYVGPGAVIGPNAKIRDFNYINRCASIGHDTVLKSFNHVGPGATICGRCHIGDGTYIGANATVRDGIEIVDNVTLGMASAATRNLVVPGTYIGVPARLKK
jgi:sugar O-acyltransferase (sialic acid O-acetyltransferase NeuD family)